MGGRIRCEEGTGLQEELDACGEDFLDERGHDPMSAPSQHEGVADEAEFVSGEELTPDIAER
ncbi:hypothetical protein ACGF8B_32295 [Streptomyces sp. NPDC047917]|uniref:hypothetical protein n=1 Tax=Streptomyces sp. NPDC047917 TaxID=3365491 RepID=UPI00371C31C7